MHFFILFANRRLGYLLSALYRMPSRKLQHNPTFIANLQSVEVVGHRDSSIYDKISTVHFTASDRLNPVIIHIIIKEIFVTLQDLYFIFLE